MKRLALALLAVGIFFGSTAGSTPAPTTTTTTGTVTTTTVAAPVHLEEDDPGWDCRVMGNHICGEVIFFDFGGQLHAWNVNGDRPACFVEPDDTVAGFSVYFYPKLSQEPAREFGFEVPCGPMPAEYRPF